MEIRFDKQYLEDLYLKGKSSDKKHRFQPQITAKYVKTIDLLESLSTVEDLYRYHSLNYEKLVGDKSGIEVEAEIVVTVCNILELSNHYK